MISRPFKIFYTTYAHLIFLEKVAAIVVQRNTSHFNSIKFREATVAQLKLCELQNEMAHFYLWRVPVQTDGELGYPEQLSQRKLKRLNKVNLYCKKKL